MCGRWKEGERSALIGSLSAETQGREDRKRGRRLLGAPFRRRPEKEEGREWRSACWVGSASGQQAPVAAPFMGRHPRRRRAADGGTNQVACPAGPSRRCRHRQSGAAAWPPPQRRARGAQPGRREMLMERRGVVQPPQAPPNGAEADRAAAPPAAGGPAATPAGSAGGGHLHAPPGGGGRDGQQLRQRWRASARWPRKPTDRRWGREGEQDAHVPATRLGTAARPALRAGSVRRGRGVTE